MCHEDKILWCSGGFDVGLVYVEGQNRGNGNKLSARTTGHGHEQRDEQRRRS